jgi:hypothetical protein
MIYRLYYWIKGAPENRPGGPWWYRDFSEQEGRDKFLQSIGPENLERALTLDKAWQGMPTHRPMDIYPPTEAEEVSLCRDRCPNQEDAGQDRRDQGRN